jgi:hypothetical protein
VAGSGYGSDALWTALSFDGKWKAGDYGNGTVYSTNLVFYNLDGRISQRTLNVRWDLPRFVVRNFDEHTSNIRGAHSLSNSERVVGKPYLGITSHLPVIRQEPQGR